MLDRRRNQWAVAVQLLPQPVAVSSGEPVERCDHPECAGALLEGRHCLEHLTTNEFASTVTRLRAGEPLDASKTTITSERLDALLDALKTDDDRPALPAANFREATFTGDADFNRTTFNDFTNFYLATFNGHGGFHEAIFNGDADFNRATFGDVGFRGAIFRGYARFRGATFSGYAAFDRAAFDGDADFGRTLFGAAAGFSAGAGFRATKFSGDAGFRGAIFSGQAAFTGATFNRIANFNATTFETAHQLGPLVVGERLILDNCLFTERVNIEAATSVLSALATTFAGGVHLRVRWAEIALDDADFARASTLSAATTWRLQSDLSPACIVDSRHIELEPRPRLITLRGAHVAALSLSDVDLRACRFLGAHGLESMTIEASCRWPRTPPTRRCHIPRETIADEHHLRGASWHEASTQTPDWLDGRGGSQMLQPAQIAALYRALRKGREEGKDEAGAADLYYGEMQMRRHRSSSVASDRERTRARIDRPILHGYWLLSGYGLRPTRALVSLAVTLLLSAALLHWFGFNETRGYGRSLLFAIESSLSLLRPPQTRLTAGGEVIQITLRLLGPLLFGLALLAVRARVKR